MVQSAVAPAQRRAGPLFTSACLGLCLVLLLVGIGCRSVSEGRFALRQGDPERGKMAFRELQCHTCHSVSGHDFPAPTVQPPVLVVLGTENHAPSRQQLVDSIVDPSHRIYPGFNRKLVQTNGVSRMGDFTEVMTVRQLCDVVAFLETLHH